MAHVPKDFIYFLILLFESLALLFLMPSYSGINVFSRGEFVVTESYGFVFTYLAIYLSALYFFFRNLFIHSGKRTTLYYIKLIFLMGSSLFLFLVIVSFIWIRQEVKIQCIFAQKTYEKSDCIDSLIALLHDEHQTYRTKNNAIYALGQLADRRALPVLKQLYTGEIPAKESLYKTISQYELKKAIKWCEQGNITSWMYKGKNKW